MSSTQHFIAAKICGKKMVAAASKEHTAEFAEIDALEQTLVSYKRKSYR